MSIPSSVIRSIQGKIARDRGERAEVFAVQILQRVGWSAVRTRRGPIDVVAGKDGKTLLVQVKSGRARIKKEELQRMIQWGVNLGASVEVWHFRGKTFVAKRRVYDPSLHRLT